VGFALVVLGRADTFPLAIARAGAVGGIAGVALASTVASEGPLGGLLLLGFLAQATELSVALSTAAVSVLVAALLVRSLPGDSASVCCRAVPNLRRAATRAVVTWASARRTRSATAPACPRGVRPGRLLTTGTLSP
jgi:hypothetical protein